MRKTSIGLLLAASLISHSAFAAATLATVNGTAIPQSRMDEEVKVLSSRNPTAKIDANVKAQIKENLIANEVVRQEALKKNIDQDPNFIKNLDQLRVATFVENFIKQHPVSEAEAKAEYDKTKVNMSSKEYLVRHILVDNEAKAKEIIAELKKGAKFDALAKAYSKDPGSAKQGGELGWAPSENYTTAFAAAIKTMPKGKISDEPVKTEFGWHIIKIDDIRTRKGPSFAEVKDAIMQQMQIEKLRKYVTDLVAKAKVTQ